MDLCELHFRFPGAPQELSRSCLGALSGSLGAHNLLIALMDRDFQAVWGPLGLFLTESLRSISLQSSKIWSSELYGNYFSGIKALRT